MPRKQLLLVAIIVVLASAFSAVVAYRRGMRRSHPPVPSFEATVEGGIEACVDFSEAGSSVGKTGCIKGRVLKVYTSRAGNTFLDFCQDYRNCPFTSVVFSSDRSKFGDLGTLRGREVELRGAVTTYRGRAEVVIHDPDQIRVTP